VNGMVGENRRNSQSALVFLALVTLTAIELTVIQLDAGRAARITALVGLAIAKVAALLFLFMDLRSAPRAIKLVAAVPLLLAPAVAIVLMMDAVYRVAGGH
jgi:heme/copper-type cytochrome/quinol oxidase subunit 4